VRVLTAAASGADAGAIPVLRREQVDLCDLAPIVGSWLRDGWPVASQAASKMPDTAAPGSEMVRRVRRRRRDTDVLLVGGRPVIRRQTREGSIGQLGSCPANTFGPLPTRHISAPTRHRLGPDCRTAQPGVAQPAASALRRRRFGRQPVAAVVAERFVFCAVDGLGLGETSRAICSLSRAA